MLQHPVQILYYVGIRHPDNPEAFAGEPIGSALVICGLVGMCVTVDFDDQLGIRAEKVGDVRPEPDLTAEFGAV